MTQEEKELLLKDLSARLPYGVIAHALEINKVGTVTDVNVSYNTINLTVDNANGDYELVPISDIKPYLRPMSSMTEEEREEWADLFNKPLLELEKYSDDKDAEEVAPQMFAMSHLSSINWLYSKHFNIILPKETFIEVTEENNPYKK